MFNFFPDLLFQLVKQFRSGLVDSQLHNENTFYPQFIKDLQKCKKEVIIESPYITSYRINLLFPVFDKLLQKGVKIFIITRNPNEHCESMRAQSEKEINIFENIGIQVLINSGYHHRKLAILDRKVLYEGSLNILSQSYSREIMRRIKSKKLTMEMFKFLKLEKVL